MLAGRRVGRSDRARTRRPVLSELAIAIVGSLHSGCRDSATDFCVCVFCCCRNKKAKEPKVKEEDKAKKKTKKSGKSKKKEQSA